MIFYLLHESPVSLKNLCMIGPVVNGTIMQQLRTLLTLNMFKYFKFNDRDRYKYNTKDPTDNT